MSKYLTQELVEETLRSAKKNPDIKVIDFHTEGGAKKGDNYASDVYNVTVSTDTNGVLERHYLFAKCIPNDDGRVEAMQLTTIFQKEATVYKKVLVDFLELQKKRGVSDAVVPGAPVLYTEIDQAERVLLFENLRMEGYTLADKLVGCDYSHCRLVMRELAKLHALSHALKKEEGKPLLEIYPMFLPPADPENKIMDSFMNIFTNSNIMTANMLENYEGGRYKSLAEKVRKLQPRKVMMELFMNMMSNEEWNVLAHGDCWINNMMFRYSSDKELPCPESVKLLDFQIMRVAAPSLDLNYFLYTSTVGSVRRLYMDKLLREYHTTFHAVLLKLGVKFESFTLEQLKKLVAEHRLYGYFMAAFVMPLMLARPEEAVGMDNMQFDSKENFGEGFQNLVNQTLQNMKHTDYQDRMLEIVQEMVEHGVI